MLQQRMKIALLMGVILGIVCIIGASVRSDTTPQWHWLFALWYNRLLMGGVIGLSIWRSNKMSVVLLRGGTIGLIVSFAFYSATGFADVISFLAGIIYGMIIDFSATRYSKS